MKQCFGFADISDFGLLFYDANNSRFNYSYEYTFTKYVNEVNYTFHFKSRMSMLQICVF